MTNVERPDVCPDCGGPNLMDTDEDWVCADCGHPVHKEQPSPPEDRDIHGH